MKTTFFNIEFIRIDEENIKLVPETFNIDGVKFSKNDLKQFISDKNNYCFAGIIENERACKIYQKYLDKKEQTILFIKKL